MVGGLKRIGPAVRLEDAILVDILDLQPGFGLQILGEFGGRAALDGLLHHIPSSRQPGVCLLPVNVLDAQRVPDELPSVVRHNFVGGGQLVLGTEWVHHASGAEVSDSGPGTLDVVDEERVGGFVDFTRVVRDRLDVGREGVVGLVGLLGYEDTGVSALDVMGEEGRLAEERLLRGEVCFACVLGALYRS